MDSRSLDTSTAESLVSDLTADDAVERVRTTLKDSIDGHAGIAEVDRLLELASPTVGDSRITFTPRLVRGLDYYTGVIFEVIAEGTPGSIASGGRYDHLIAAMGGPDFPACGVSLGVERIIDLIEDDESKRQRLDVAITVMNEESESELIRFATDLRKAHIRTEIYLGTSHKLSKQLKWAADRRARFALIYGQRERGEGVVTIRDMDTGEQTSSPVAELATRLKERCTVET